MFMSINNGIESRSGFIACTTSFLFFNIIHLHLLWFNLLFFTYLFLSLRLHHWYLSDRYRRLFLLGLSIKCIVATVFMHGCKFASMHLPSWAKLIWPGSNMTIVFDVLRQLAEILSKPIMVSKNKWAGYLLVGMLENLATSLQRSLRTTLLRPQWHHDALG